MLEVFVNPASCEVSRALLSRGPPGEKVGATLALGGDVNLQKIDAEYDADALEVFYLRDVAERLERIVHSNPSVDVAIALIEVLTAKTIVFVDGFVANDRSALTTTIGYAEAEVVVAALYDDGDLDAVWLRGMRLRSESSTPHFDSVMRRVASRVRESELVAGIS